MRVFGNGANKFKHRNKPIIRFSFSFRIDKCLKFRDQDRYLKLVKNRIAIVINEPQTDRVFKWPGGQNTSKDTADIRKCSQRIAVFILPLHIESHSLLQMRQCQGSICTY